MLTPEQLAEIERWFGMYRDDTYQHGQALLAEVKRLQAKVDAAGKVAEQLDQDASDDDATRNEHINELINTTGSWSGRDPDIARLGALRDTQREIATTLRRTLTEAGEGR